MAVGYVPSRVILQRQLYGDQYRRLEDEHGLSFGHKKALHLHLRLI